MDTHINQAEEIVEMVWYGGTDAIFQGEGVCFNFDYGTATEADGSRRNRVERPSTTNNRHFAGVSRADHTAQAGGQFIEINKPGSTCMVALGVDTMLDTGILTCQAAGAAGRFSDAGFPGRGSIVPLQTVTAVLERTVDGTGSLLATDGKTLTVADSSDMAVGDTVVFLAGEDDGTGVWSFGKYAIGSITNATTIVLSTSALSTLTTGSLTCSFYIYTGNPRCLAYLQDGEESGLVTWLSPLNTGTGGADLTFMAGGFHRINGGVTIGSDDCEGDLADGTFYGEKIGFVLMGDLATKDFVVDLATNGLQNDGSTALAEVNAIDDVTDAVIMEWQGQWRTIGLMTGAAEA